MAAYMALGDYDAELGAADPMALDASYNDYPTDVADSPGFTTEPEGSGTGFDWSSVGSTAIDVLGAVTPIFANIFHPTAGQVPVGAQPVVGGGVRTTTTGGALAGGISSKTLLVVGGLGLAAILLTRKR